MEYYFDAAGISFRDGMLIVNATNYRLITEHEKVKVFVDGNICKVTADQVHYDIVGLGYCPEIEYVSESSIEYVKKHWFTSVKVPRVKSGMVELKKRTPKTYTSNNFTIIQ